VLCDQQNILHGQHNFSNFFKVYEVIDKMERKRNSCYDVLKFCNKVRGAYVKLKD